MNKETALLYLSSQSIQDYCEEHPIIWHRKEDTFDGDVLTPTPAMAMFFGLLSETGALFSQAEYWHYARSGWGDWISGLSARTINGLRARLDRNFYPSAIDSLHVWALLVETGLFARCSIDTVADAVGKADITVWPTLGGTAIKIGLRAGTRYCDARTEYKRRYRGATDAEMIDIVLDMGRPQSPGNKRWYSVDDLQPVIDRAMAWADIPF